MICVDPAPEHSNVELLTGACVERLETDLSGRVLTNVVVTRREKNTPRISWWSPAGAINSAALPLRSANDKHPPGRANSSDVVGRHYMRHNCSAFKITHRYSLDQFAGLMDQHQPDAIKEVIEWA